MYEEVRYAIVEATSNHFHHSQDTLYDHHKGKVSLLLYLGCDSTLRVHRENGGSILHYLAKQRPTTNNSQERICALMQIINGKGAIDINRVDGVSVQDL